MAKTKKDIVKYIPNEVIVNKIFFVRGQKVMLDYDLAALYSVETRVLNQAVKRNMIRFSEEFMFRLTLKEWNDMRSQIVISSPEGSTNQRNMRSQTVTSSQQKRKKGYVPYAFTEHGVAMIAMVLKSERAVKMSMAIVRTLSS